MSSELIPIYIDAREIAVQEGLNSRFDYGEIEELMLSIVSNGVENPLQGWKGEDGKYYPSDGHRRTAALQMAIEKGLPLKPVPFIVRVLSEKQKIMHQITLNSGKPLEVLEEAVIYRRLIDEHGMNFKELITFSGKSKNHINGLLTLAYADEEIKNKVRSGEISASNAIKIINLNRDDKDAQLEIIEEGAKIAKESGKDKVTRSSLAILKEKTPAGRIKMLIQKSQVKALTGAAFDPSVSATLILVDKVFNSGITVDKAVEELLEINKPK